MKSAEYWEQRALASEAAARSAADEALSLKVLTAYSDAEKQINREIKKIFNRYATDGKLTAQEANKLLSSRESDAVLDELRAKLAGISDPAVKRKALNRLNARAYAGRLSRLDALRESIRAQAASVASAQTAATEQLKASTAVNTFYRAMFDIQQGTGYGFSFSSLPQAVIDSIVNDAWQGKHFSTRVWKNTQLLAEQSNRIVAQGIITGDSVYNISNKLAQAVESGKYAAVRLVRTETNRAYNAAQMQAYKQSSAGKYRYLATLDARTCKVCGALDGEIFELSEAKEGVNYPPLHPNDRCTTVIHFDGDDLSRLKRRARDPKTGKTHLVPGDMTYEEWRKGVNEKAGYDIIKASRNSKRDAEQYERSAAMPLSSKYKQFSDAAGLPTKMERTRLSSYHRVKTPKELAKSEKSGIIKETKFNCYGDNLRKKLGSAKDNNSQEVSDIQKNVEKMGGSLSFLKDNTKMVCNIYKGKPGYIEVDENVSIAGLRHEYRHFLDDVGNGNPGLSYYLKDKDRFFEYEKRGYEEEISLAKELGYDDIVQEIRKEIEQRRMEIYGK